MEENTVGLTQKEIENNQEKKEQKERGARIKRIREKELELNKLQLAKEIGITAQFLGQIEEGRGNLVYKSLKRLKRISGHSTDYILYGIDDEVIASTRKLLEHYDEKEIREALEALNNIAMFIKDKNHRLNNVNE